LLADPNTFRRDVSDICSIHWSRDHERFCDLPCSTLKWADVILDNVETAQTAIVAKREDDTARIATYGDLADEIHSLTAGLLGIGLRRGDRTGLLMDNGVEASVSLLAVAHVEMIVAPLFNGLGTDATITRLASCVPQALFATSGFHRPGCFLSTHETIAATHRELPELAYPTPSRGRPSWRSSAASGRRQATIIAGESGGCRGHRVVLSAKHRSEPWIFSYAAKRS
jgi:acetyl-CoA synthetase